MVTGRPAFHLSPLDLSRDEPLLVLAYSPSKWLNALLLGVHSTSAIATSRLEGLRSGLPKTHPAILLNAIHSQCPRRIGCDNKRSCTWLQETGSLCYLLSHGIITIFRLILSLDYIEDYITQIKICQEGICSLQ